MTHGKGSTEERVCRVMVSGGALAQVQPRRTPILQDAVDREDGDGLLYSALHSFRLLLRQIVECPIFGG